MKKPLARVTPSSNSSKPSERTFLADTSWVKSTTATLRKNSPGRDAKQNEFAVIRFAKLRTPTAITTFAAVCEGVRVWLEEAAGDNVALIAEALELEVRASPDEAELLGKLPFLSHHWTNMGMTTWT